MGPFTQELSNTKNLPSFQTATQCVYIEALWSVLTKGYYLSLMRLAINLLQIILPQCDALLFSQYIWWKFQ